MSYNKMMKMQKPKRGPKQGGSYMGFDAGTVRPVSHKSAGLAAYQNILTWFKYRHTDNFQLTKECISEAMPIAKSWLRT